MFITLVWRQIHRLASTNLWAFSFFNLPFSLAHEFAHYCVALLVNGKPTSLSVIPKRNDSVIVLGEVVCANINWLNALPISIAPLTLVLIPIESHQFWFSCWGYSLASLTIFVWLTAALIYAATPSRQDFKVALSQPVGIAFYLTTATALTYYF